MNKQIMCSLALSTLSLWAQSPVEITNQERAFKAALQGGNISAAEDVVKWLYRHNQEKLGLQHEVQLCRYKEQALQARAQSLEEQLTRKPAEQKRDRSAGKLLKVEARLTEFEKHIREINDILFDDVSGNRVPAAQKAAQKLGDDVKSVRLALR